MVYIQNAGIVGDEDTLQAPSAPALSKPSRSFNSLPQFVQPLWKSVIIPSVLDRVGAYDNSFSLDKNNRFQTDLQDIINRAFPGSRVQVLKKNPIYRVVRH